MILYLYTAYLTAAIVINLSILLLQAFSSVIFRICGVSCGPSTYAELLV